MNTEIESKLQQDILGFRLPRFHEIPDIGLFLEQTVRFINQCFAPLGEMELTPSMVSNYVKHELVSRPVKKTYRRAQLAYLIFIAAAKTVTPLDDIKKLFALQRGSYPIDIAYNYFCSEFEEVLQEIFHNTLPHSENYENNETLKKLLRNVITTFAHKIYLMKYFKALDEVLPRE